MNLPLPPLLLIALLVAVGHTTGRLASNCQSSIDFETITPICGIGLSRWCVCWPLPWQAVGLEEARQWVALRISTLALISVPLSWLTWRLLKLDGLKRKADPPSISGSQLKWWRWWRRTWRHTRSVRWLAGAGDENTFIHKYSARYGRFTTAVCVCVRFAANTNTASLPKAHSLATLSGLALFSLAPLLRRSARDDRVRTCWRLTSATGDRLALGRKGLRASRASP